MKVKLVFGDEHSIGEHILRGIQLEKLGNRVMEIVNIDEVNESLKKNFFAAYFEEIQREIELKVFERMQQEKANHQKAIEEIIDVLDRNNLNPNAVAVS